MVRPGRKSLLNRLVGVTTAVAVRRRLRVVGTLILC
jgi:hypothetical protein